MLGCLKCIAYVSELPKKPHSAGFVDVFNLSVDTRRRCPVCQAFLELVITAKEVLYMCPTEIPSHYVEKVRDIGAS